jgi:hypothetical protein
MDFEDTDPWILCAIALAPHPASLRQVISVADYLNAALPSLLELNGALGRLGRAGLVRRTGDILEISESVRSFQHRSVRTPARLFVRHLGEFLAKTAPGASMEPTPFTQLELDSATDEYTRAFQNTVLKPQGEGGKP